ncbi:MAG: hypothetical protein ACO3A4_02860 [Silvanigrellaceae bacterium]
MSNVKLRNGRNTLVGLVAVLVIGLGVYFTTRQTTSAPSPQADSPAGASSAVDKATFEQALVRYSLNTDEVRTFGFLQDMSVEMNPAQGQSTVSRIHLRGQFDEQLVSVSGNRLTYRYNFHDVQFESTDAEGRAALPPDEVNNIVQSVVGTTLLLKTDVLHSSISWSVTRQTNLETLNLLRSVVLSGSVFLPAAKDLSEWTGTEEDSTGIFTLNHKLISLGNGKAQIEKEPRMVRVPEDFGLAGHSTQQSVVVLPSSSTKIEFDATAGHLLKADQRWSMRAQAAGLLATTNLRTQVDFQSKRKATDEDRKFLQSDIASTDSGNGFISEFELQAAHSTSIKRKVAAQKLAGENWASLRSLLMSPDFHKDGAARAKFFEQLSALLYLQPELCTTVADEIARLDRQDPDYKSKLSLLAGVFSSQETPEAEAAMVALAERMKEDSSALMQVIPAMAAHRNPSERTRDALMQSYTQAVDEGVKSTATLALGTFASRARNSRPDLTRETVERLKQDFDSSSAINKKVTLSGALGNVGANEALESVKSLFAASQDASLKRSAIYDLRFVNDPQVDVFLQQVVTDSATDPELVVQGVRVMRMRPPLKMHLQTMTTLFRTKGVRATLRSEALYTISYLSPVSPEEVQKLLEEAAKDANPQIAKQAEQLLARQTQPL